MVWAGISVNLRTKLYIVNGNLNSQLYIDEILRPLVLPFYNKLAQTPFSKMITPDRTVGEL